MQGGTSFNTFSDFILDNRVFQFPEGERIVAEERERRSRRRAEERQQLADGQVRPNNIVSVFWGVGVILYIGTPPSPTF